MEKTKPTRKRELTPEQLERLAKAREKALAVRQQLAAKNKELNDLQKKAQEKRMNDEIEKLKKQVGGQDKKKPVEKETEPEQEEIEEEAPPAPKPKPAKKPAKPKKDILKQVIEESSDDSGSDDEDDSGDLVKQYLKDKYKTIYKTRYEAKTLSQLSTGLAKQHIKNKVNDEMLRLASISIFGS